MLSSEVRRLEDENRSLREELRVWKGKGEMERPKICRYCKFYYQHYGKTGGVYHEVDCGHCVNGQKTKGRKPDATCEYFEYKARDNGRLT